MPDSNQITPRSDVICASTSKPSKNSNGEKYPAADGKLVVQVEGGKVDGEVNGGGVLISKDTSTDDVNRSISMQDEGGEGGQEKEQLNDPVEFWNAWSARQISCMNSDHQQQVGPDGKKLAVCSCFEGLGSVM